MYNVLHDRRGALNKDTDPRVATSPTKKVGRNEPCPCGSDKKYKKCCGLN